MRVNERTRAGYCNESSKTPVAHEADIRFVAADAPHPERRRHHARTRCKHRINGDDTDTEVGSCERGARIKPEPSECEDERSEHGHRDAVRWNGADLPFDVLADTRAEHPSADKADRTTYHVHDRRTRKVDVPVA